MPILLIMLIIAGSSYLLGSIPFGYLLVRTVRGEDVRRTGSGNIGATNVSRKSPALGALTLVLDALKGAVTVSIAHIISNRSPDSSLHISGILAAEAALFAVLGHMFPLWLKFRGGKGVATALGGFGMIAPKAVVFAAGIFILLVILFRFISLASIVTAVIFPALIWRTQGYGKSAVSLLLISLACVLIVIRHYENLQRLLAGAEHRLGSRTE